MVRRNVAVLLLVLASVGIASDAVAQSADPRSVVDAFQVARNRRDLDGAMELLADDVTVIDTNSRALTSKDEIRRFLQSTFWRGRFVIVSNEQVEGTHVSWNERMAWNERVGGQLFNRTEFRGDAIVQDGKIKLLTYDVSGLVRLAEPPPPSSAPLPAAVGLGSVVAAIAGAIWFVSRGTLGWGTAHGDSTLRGRMLSELRDWDLGAAQSGYTVASLAGLRIRQATPNPRSGVSAEE